MQTFPNLHTNLFKCSRHTFLKEGLRGFYSGTLPGVLSILSALLFFQAISEKSMNFHSLPALVAIAAENSLLFMAYGATQRLVSRMARVQEEELDVLGHGLAGGLKILLTYLLFNRQFSQVAWLHFGLPSSSAQRSWSSVACRRRERPR